MVADRPATQAVGPGFSRRTFLQAGVATGGGLVLSMRLPFASRGAEAADAGAFVPNAFIRIEGDGRVILTTPYVEMGQGTYTCIAMMIAEELEVDLPRIQLEHAPPMKSFTAIRCWAGSRRRAIRTRYAHRGTRCAKPVRSRGRCSCRRQQSAGMSIRRPAARKRVKCFTPQQRGDSNTASSPPTPRKSLCLTACRSSGPKILSLSAPRPSVSTHLLRSTEQPSMASTFGRGREDCDPCAIAGLRRAREERG